MLKEGLTGYGINAVNGNFSGGASGFWIENGKIMHPVKSITIAGKASDMEKTFASPTFRVREMQIGGK